MKTTDLRHYNRKEQRNLKIEMNLYCLLVGKKLESSCIINGLPACGKIIDIQYNSMPTFNFVRLILENGADYCIETKYGKLKPSDSYKIINNN
jgi:hypothetical protein